MPEINPIAQAQIDKIAEDCKRIKPLVAIQCITYNHEPYIRDALEGFVMQKTDFPFVAIVHDDASTDGTAAIIREYAEKYPDIIKPIFEKENQYSKPDGSLSRILIAALNATEAKYIAMCEGDDYWIDLQKLQKQSDILNNNPNIVYVCHDFKTIDLEGNIISETNYHYTDDSGFEFDIKYPFLNRWITKTLTAMYRTSVMPKLKILNKFKYSRDVHLVYYILRNGIGYYMNDIMGIYRNNGKGVFTRLDNFQKANLTYNLYSEFYNYEKSDTIKKCLISSFNYLILTSIKRLRLPLPKNILELNVYLKFIPSIFNKYIQK